VTPWAIPWPCVHEFLGVVTRVGIFDPPTALDAAIAEVEGWRGSPSLRLLGEASGHWARLTGLMTAGSVVGAKVHDAEIAAICLEHGVTELWSADRDFSRFPSLRTRNPLVDPP